MEMEFAPSGLVTETTQKMGKGQHKAPEAANRHGAALVYTGDSGTQACP